LYRYDAAVVSFSHFIPHLRLYRGHPNLNKAGLYKLS
jgi:hypothetical protein